MKKLAGILIQTGVDATTAMTVPTGTQDDQFTAIRPRYARLVLSYATARLWVAGASMLVAMGGIESGIGLIWSEAMPALGPMGLVLDWVPPPGFPDLYEEELEVSITTLGTGQANGVAFELWYDLVQGNEMELVQQRGW